MADEETWREIDAEPRAVLFLWRRDEDGQR